MIVIRWFDHYLQTQIQQKTHKILLIMMMRMIIHKVNHQAYFQDCLEKIINL